MSNVELKDIKNYNLAKASLGMFLITLQEKYGLQSQSIIAILGQKIIQYSNYVEQVEDKEDE